MQYSSWREQSITIKAGETKQVVFDETTKPNMFMIQNPNPTVLKVNINSIPYENKYHFEIGTNSSQTIGRPTPTPSLFILNPSSESITITLFSVYDNFDMNVLKNMNMNIEGATFTDDGIIRGFANGVQLPTGGNTIGQVELGATATGLVTTIKNLIDNIKSFLSNTFDGTKTIGKVNVIDTVPIKVQTDISGQALKVYENNLTGINSIEVSGVTTSTNIDMSITNRLLLLSNDGTNDIKLTFTEGANSEIFTLKSGESLSDINMKDIDITVEPKTGGQLISFRFLGGVQ